MEQVVVLVLASGKGERFVASGGAGSKLQAMLGGKSVLARTLEAVHASGLAWHLEDAGHAGMGDSIGAAARAASGAQGWLVLPGDLPLVRPQTLRRVAEALREHGLVVPFFQGRQGHPVGFGRAWGAQLAALSGPRGAASLLRDGTPWRLDVDDEGAVTDVDTLEDLATAERLLALRR
ncbi:MAG TPA: NTP transferase domain-containing protein [Ramlibacter sp.]|nr:NTP transferase domain-containing protein [Ramlibacter sp.]